MYKRCMSFFSSLCVKIFFSVNAWCSYRPTCRWLHWNKQLPCFRALHMSLHTFSSLKHINQWVWFVKWGSFHQSPSSRLSTLKHGVACHSSYMYYWQYFIICITCRVRSTFLSRASSRFLSPHKVCCWCQELYSGACNPASISSFSFPCKDKPGIYSPCCTRYTLL